MKRELLTLLKEKNWSCAPTQELSPLYRSIRYDNDQYTYVLSCANFSLRAVRISKETGKYDHCSVFFSLLYSTISRDLFIRAFRKVRKMYKKCEVMESERVNLVCA